MPHRSRLPEAAGELGTSRARLYEVISDGGWMEFHSETCTRCSDEGFVGWLPRPDVHECASKSAIEMREGSDAVPRCPWLSTRSPLVAFPQSPYGESNSCAEARGS